MSCLPHRTKTVATVLVGLLFCGWLGVARAQALYIGANYHPHDSTPETWARDIRLMQQAGVKVVRMGHLAWDSYEPREGEFEFAWFDQVMDQMQQANIKVVLDVAVRPAPSWLHQRFPAIDITDFNGNVRPANHRYMEDVGDPDYQRYALRFAKALVEHYARHPALLAFGMDNEPGDGPISYSATVRQRFIQWLKDKYQTPERLSEVWAGQRWSRRITDFNQVILPRSGGMDGAPERVLDFRQFISDEVRLFQTRVIAQTHAIAPNAHITGNMWYYSPLKQFDYAPIAYSGAVSRGGAGCYPGNSLIENGGLRHAMFGVMRIQYESSTPFWCTEFTTMTAAPGSIRKTAFASLLFGNQMVLGWTWASMHSGEEQYLQGLLDWDGQPNRKYDEYRQIATEFARIEAHGFPYQVQADVAIALSFPSQIASVSFPQSHEAQAQSAFDVMFERNVDVRLVDVEHSDLNYKLLIVPGMVVMSESSAARIRQFVANGGTLIMSAGSALVDESGKVFSSGLPGRLADVFGVRVASYEDTRVMNEVGTAGLQGEAIELALGDVRISSESPRFDVIQPQGAQVLGALTGFRESFPLVTQHAFGKGQAIYLGIPARADVLGPIVDRLSPALHLHAGPKVPKGVLARMTDARHALYVNLDAEAKTIAMDRDARSLLHEAHYREAFVLGPNDVEFIEYAD